MMQAPFLLAIDQGTTSTRAVVFDGHGRSCGSAGQELQQYYPRPGWVEHDVEEIWQAVATVVPQALEAAGIEGRHLVALGVTNQRETVVVWERSSGLPVHRAIVWQDRRSAELCRQHAAAESWLHERTGLVLDPYFSATKLQWLFQRDTEIARRARGGELLAGTIDTFLLWRLTGGKHLTDRTNASRTLLLNLESTQWDDELLRFFSIPACLLPEVRASSDDFGVTGRLDFLPEGVPIRAVAGDQQAALFGHGAFSPGEAKCTYGTGAFFLQHLGPQAARSQHRLLTSLAATSADRREYVLEGSVFVAGAAVQWLRDGLHLFDSAAAIENLARQSDPEQRVIFVPGLVGLGAPHWVPEARGVLFGLTRSTTAAELARAALEGVACQVTDLVQAAARDAAQPLACLRVDGGMANNAWFLQCQADLLGIPVIPASIAETTALGVAYLAGLASGVWSGLDALRQLGNSGDPVEPRLSEEARHSQLRTWQRAVQAVIGYYAEGEESSSGPLNNHSSSSTETGDGMMPAR